MLTYRRYRVTKGSRLCAGQVEAAEIALDMGGGGGDRPESGGDGGGRLSSGDPRPQAATGILVGILQWQLRGSIEPLRDS